MLNPSISPSTEISQETEDLFESTMNDIQTKFSQENFQDAFQLVEIIENYLTSENSFSISLDSDQIALIHNVKLAYWKKEFQKYYQRIQKELLIPNLKAARNFYAESNKIMNILHKLGHDTQKIRDKLQKTLEKIQKEENQVEKLMKIMELKKRAHEILPDAPKPFNLPLKIPDDDNKMSNQAKNAVFQEISNSKEEKPLISNQKKETELILNSNDSVLNHQERVLDTNGELPSIPIQLNADPEKNCFSDCAVEYESDSSDYNHLQPIKDEVTYNIPNDSGQSDDRIRDFQDKTKIFSHSQLETFSKQNNTKKTKSKFAEIFHKNGYQYFSFLKLRSINHSYSVGFDFFNDLIIGIFDGFYWKYSEKNPSSYIDMIFTKQFPLSGQFKQDENGFQFESNEENFGELEQNAMIEKYLIRPHKLIHSITSLLNPRTKLNIDQTFSASISIQEFVFNQISSLIHPVKKKIPILFTIEQFNSLQQYFLEYLEHLLHILFSKFIQLVNPSTALIGKKLVHVMIYGMILAENKLISKHSKLGIPQHKFYYVDSNLLSKILPYFSEKNQYGNFILQNLWRNQQEPLEKQRYYSSQMYCNLALAVTFGAGAYFWDNSKNISIIMGVISLILICLKLWKKSRLSRLNPLTDQQNHNIELRFILYGKKWIQNLSLKFFQDIFMEEYHLHIQESEEKKHSKFSKHSKISERKKSSDISKSSQARKYNKRLIRDQKTMLLKPESNHNDKHGEIKSLELSKGSISYEKRNYDEILSSQTSQNVSKMGELSMKTEILSPKRNSLKNDPNLIDSASLSFKKLRIADFLDD